MSEHPHVGWVLVRSEEHGPVVVGAAGTHYLSDGRVEGEDPLGRFAATAPHHLRRTDGFTHAPDLLIGSFYDAALDEGCAFEELISFHGGLGGPQTRPFVLHPGVVADARGAGRRRGVAVSGARRLAGAARGSECVAG